MIKENNKSDIIHSKRLSARTSLINRIEYLRALGDQRYESELNKLEEIQQKIEERMITEQIIREKKESDRLNSPSYQQKLRESEELQEQLAGRTFEDVHKSKFQAALAHLTVFREDQSFSNWRSSFKIKPNLEIWIYLKCRIHPKVALHPTFENFKARKFRCKGCARMQRQQELLKIKENYYATVWQLTETQYQKHILVINPHRFKRGQVYHLDHRFSIAEGFRRNIDPAIIASAYNLEMLTRGDNIRKGDGCSINEVELREGARRYRRLG